MPEATEIHCQEKIQLIEKMPLKNGCQQWLLKTETPLSLVPGSTLILDSVKLPVLWQTEEKQFYCLSLSENNFTEKTLWENYFFNSSPIKIQGHKNANLTLLICKNNGLFYALHQLYNWRQQKQLPENILVIAEAFSKQPFQLQPSRIFTSLVPAEATATLALLDDWGIVARFVNEPWQPGCFQGSVEQLENFVCKSQVASSTHKFYFGW